MASHITGPSPADNCLGAARLRVQHTIPRPHVSMDMHAENRGRLVARLSSEGVEAAAVVLLQGGPSVTRHETDHELLFRQESNFHWAFGIKEPDFYGAIMVGSGRSLVFVPRLPASYAVWMGAIKTTEQWRGEYGVDEVHYIDELSAVLGKLAPSRLLLTKGLNTDSKSWAVPASFEGIDAFKTDDSALLWDCLAECRVRKTKREQELLRYISLVSSEAHIAVMQHARPGQTESQLESLFRHWCYYNGGARYLSYTCICASGHNGSVLHYGHAGEPNAKVIKDGDLCLFDMGGEFHCYGADITTTFPANGVFSADQRMVYEAVLAAQTAVINALKPGVHWVDMHALAYREILTHLRDGGLLHGDVDAMLAADLGAVFMPHGLGHMLGIDTHDVGGYPANAPARPTAPGFSSLRTARILEADMYLTVEPGIYFIDHLLDAALADPKRSAFIHAEALARFRGFGGVRLEDDILITIDGCENFTHAPRTVADIEAMCSGRISQRVELAKCH